MAQELPVLQPPALQNGERCRQLLSKGLYINAGLPKGQEIVGDGNFWCGKTQTIFGPDKGLGDGERCLNESRSCYES